MKTIVHTRYGPPEVLHLAEIDKPVPQDGEILVKIAATLATIGDCRMRSFRVPPAQWLFARLYLGILRPRRQVLGMALAGAVEATGRGVTQVQPGGAVLASTFSVNFGAYAESKCLPESGPVAPKPPSLSYPEAAALLGGSTAALRCFDAVHKLSPAQGKRVLKPQGIYLDVDTASGSGEKKEDLTLIVNLAEKGTSRPVIDRCYDLNRIVEAHRYVDQGHKRGNVVITVGQKEEPV